MSYSVQMTAEAWQDLNGIFEYIAFELQSVNNATGQIERLEKSINSLTELPFRYREYDDPYWKSKGLRIMPVDKYIVLYAPDKDDQTVTIIRIIHGSRDIPNRLQDK